MAFTIQDIAKKSGVGASTVSRVLNNHRYVNPSVRKKVLAIIGRTGYRPNRQALTLRTQKTNVIAVCAPGMGLASSENRFYISEIMMGAGMEINGTGKYDMLLQLTSSGMEGRRYAELFDEKKADGAVVIFPRSDDPGVAELERRDLPAVVIGNGPGTRLGHIKPDNTAGTRRAVEHLLEQGCRRIAAVNLQANVKGHRWSDAFERLEAYRAALAANGLAVDEGLILLGDYADVPAPGPLRALMARGPDAILAMDDIIAIRTMKLLRREGYRIPRDVKVVGFDDIPQAASSEPPLTTIRQPFLETGREAARMVIARMEGKAPGQRRSILPVELVARGSTKAGTSISR